MSATRRARPLLGTLVEISVDTARRPPATQRAIDRAFAEIERVHILMNYHDPGSEISRINREAHAHAVTVSEDTWGVLAAARRMSAFSAGLFDVTVAPLLADAGFVSHDGSDTDALRGACWRDVELLSDRRVCLRRPLRIDLSGIAKGYAVDLAVESLERDGIRAGHVNAGGDLRFFGDLPSAVHIRHPQRPTALIPILSCHSAVATSAGYYRRRICAGREVCAVAHPQRGTLCDATRSVTVFADDCMTADALTKVIHADPARGRHLLRWRRARAVIIDADPRTGECRLYDSASQLDVAATPARRASGA